MKKKKIFLMIPFLFLVMGMMSGCEDKETYPEAVIIKQLPKITRIGSNTKSIVVQSQKELETVLSKEDLEPFDFLQQIDFSKYTLLLGYGGYGNEVSTMEHSFTKTGATYYTYLLKIAGDATRPDSFRYGILVNKLPESAKVVFKIEELHLDN